MALRTFVKFTAVGRLMMIPPRLVLFALLPALRQFGIATRWVFTSKEYYNLTYHLTELNKSYLASYIAVVTGHDVAKIEGYIRELENDTALRSVLIERTQQSRDRHSCDVEPRYGRRIGWYALVRATKPRVVVETGVDRGLGTAVMAAALRKNQEEGFPGKLYATDIMADCGHLMVAPYKEHCEILLGDSVELLKKFAQPVDIFIHDSDHTPAYEWAEFKAIEPRLHAESLVMSDNSAQTTKLREFAAERNQSFLFFQDQPKNHWWGGDGIGCVFTPGKKTIFQTRSTQK